MIRRLFWVALGFGFGVSLALWFTRILRRTVRRYSPDHVAARAVDVVRDLGHDLREAWREGREAMREREAELWARLEAPLYPGASAGRG